MGVAGTRQHADVRAGAEDALLARADHDRAHFRVFEAQALDGVGQFDVDAEVVGIELQFVAIEQPAGLVDIHDEVRDRAVRLDPPVAVAGGIGLKIDLLGFGHRFRRSSLLGRH